MSAVRSRGSRGAGSSPSAGSPGSTAAAAAAEEEEEEEEEEQPPSNKNIVFGFVMDPFVKTGLLVTWIILLVRFLLIN
jgi:hypothetical protein